MLKNLSRYTRRLIIDKYYPNHVYEKKIYPYGYNNSKHYEVIIRLLEDDFKILIGDKSKEIGFIRYRPYSGQIGLL
ncbi:MAG: hypothetical protein WD512_01825, partial [Candidatus Paceibacterota bacterium]